MATIKESKEGDVESDISKILDPDKLFIANQTFEDESFAANQTVKEEYSVGNQTIKEEIKDESFIANGNGESLIANIGMVAENSFMANQTTETVEEKSFVGN
ncbi:hypothetical protein PtA15_1A258 [Puccinia triticina]|uniref:Uncharacterized protein n=1 Tax=Puccinia triticina TaxID=208348 RepID=A0ABY7C6Z5_9BASI|nr:uncharacterized protein PtA15_1A258 [Puccinia triticina]WAQ80920.1 hypothetical protein PtA15_1A258 [Puccinia triticina]